MNTASKETDHRRRLAYVNAVGTTYLHLKSPLIVALWSVAFPGAGHLLLSKYLRGFLLFIWEIFINGKAHINLLILYSFIGDFEKAKEVVNLHWLFLYIPTYIFCIWDSYRAAVDLNHQYLLTENEDARISPFYLSAFEINYLDKRKPWLAAVWSAFAPGAGQLYNQNIIAAIFIWSFWVCVVYFSNLLPGIYLTFLGLFDETKQLLNMHWLLNIPSLYLFAIFFAYMCTVENNKLFEHEQARLLRTNYQAVPFKLPLENYNRGDYMYTVATFEHTIFLELALQALQKQGVPKEKILAVPMSKKKKDPLIFDSIHRSDGQSTLDVPCILAVLFGALGSIYGFVLYWGPLIWGLIGIVFGLLLGLALKIYSKKLSFKQYLKKTEVVLIVEGLENQTEMIEQTLWNHHAIGVSRLDSDKKCR